MAGQNRNQDIKRKATVVLQKYINYVFQASSLQLLGLRVDRLIDPQSLNFKFTQKGTQCVMDDGRIGNEMF